MCRFPPKFQQREETFTHTSRSSDLHSLKKDVLVGEHLEWFTSMQMQNSLTYPRLAEDVVLSLPLGMGLLAGESRTPLYCRVFD